MKQWFQKDLSIERHGPRQLKPQKEEIDTLKSLARKAPLYRETYIIDFVIHPIPIRSFVRVSLIRVPWSPLPLSPLPCIEKY